ncbi:Uncharacterised protein [Mycobacterium tuberculosis]|nr:Uncharacterised protein [Mycobacterium tuberculosis]
MIAVKAASERIGMGRAPNRSIPSPEHEGPCPHGLMAVGMILK